MKRAGNGTDRWIGNAAVAALAIGALATALNPVFVRLSDLEPAGSAFHRMAWALPLMWSWMLLEKPATGTARKPPTHHRWLLALCGLFFAGDLTALHWSIQLTSVANAILFLNAQPIYVVVGAWLLFRERVSKLFLVGVASAMLGAGAMLGESAEFGADRLLGDALGVVAGLCYAGYILAANRLRRHSSSATINAWTCLVACPLLLAVAVATGQGVIPESPLGWALMIGLGVISQACGQGFIVWGMRHLAASFSALVLLLAPVASALYAWGLLSEPMAAWQIAGMLLVLTGIWIAHRSGASEVARRPAA